jgi:hypothetical protein
MRRNPPGADCVALLASHNYHNKCIVRRGCAPLIWPQHYIGRMPIRSHHPDNVEHRTPLQLPLADLDRDAATAAFAELGVRVSGDRPDQLVAYIATALVPVSATYRVAGMTAAQVAEHAADTKEIRKRLAALAAAASAVLEVLPPAASSDAYAAAVASKPWLTRANPFGAAVSVMLPDPKVRPRLHTLRNDIFRLATLRPPPPAGRKPYDSGPGAGLVRAVCLYVHQQPGLTLQMTWREPQKDEAAPSGARGGAHQRRGQTLQPVDATTALIAAAACIFGVPADNSKLKTHLLNYAAELRADGSRDPSPGDLYGTSWDSKPPPAKASKAKIGS